MKKLICLAVLVATASTVLAMGNAPKKEESSASAPVILAEKVFLVDNFESGSLKGLRDWWTFDIEKASAVSNKDLKGGDEKVAAEVGAYSMGLNGVSKNWYAGGAGTYIAKEN